MADTPNEGRPAATAEGAPAASTSAPKKTARLANFPPVPPPIPRGPQVPDPSRPGATDDDEDEDDEDAAGEDGESSGAESVFDEPINTGGNTLADRIQAKLDEREFQDEQKRQERIVEIDAGGDQEAEALRLQEEQQKQQQDDLAGEPTRPFNGRNVVCLRQKATLADKLPVIQSYLPSTRTIPR